MRTLIIDVDGVLLDWNDSFWYFMREKGHKAEYTPHENPDHDIAYAFPEIPRDQLDFLIQEFNRSILFGSLRRMPDVYDSLVFLRQSFKLVALTCSGQSPKSVLLRANNLLQFDGVLSEIHFGPLAGSKVHQLQQFPQNSILLDDNPQYIKEAVTIGMEAWIFDQSWNRSFDHPKRVFDWMDARKLR